MKHLIRLFSLALAVCLLLCAVPAPKASALAEKAAADAQLPQDLLTTGGSAPVLNAADPVIIEESEPNNSLSTADAAQVEAIIGGVTSSSDKYDYYKLTLSKDSDIMFVSESTGPTMLFGLLDSTGKELAYCDSYGSQDGYYVDAISGTLKAGTYYILVCQLDYANVQAYAQSLEYAIYLHVHSYTVTDQAESTCTEHGYKTYTCSICEFYYTEELELADHDYVAGTPVPPTCTESGYTPYTCSVCDRTTQDDFIKELGHDPDVTQVTADPDNHKHSFPCTRCDKTITEACSYARDPETGSFACSVCGSTIDCNVFRIYGETRIETSMAIADTLKAELGVSKFDTIIVASSQNFPDALSGSYLAAQKNAPILLTNQKSEADVITYITTNLSSTGKVYILGGENAVDANFETWLTQIGIDCVRLAGETRFDTNLAILEEAGNVDEIVICTAYGFADSLSVSASGKPILLVGEQLTEAQKEFLKENASGYFVIVGGTNAVNETIEEELDAYAATSIVRLAGANRYETSTMVAERFFPEPSQVVLAYAQNYPDGLCGGPLAYRMGAPLILTDGDCSFANAYMAWRDIEGGYVLGGSILIDDRTVRSLFDLAENQPIPAL